MVDHSLPSDSSVQGSRAPLFEKTLLYGAATPIQSLPFLLPPGLERARFRAALCFSSDPSVYAGDKTRMFVCLVYLFVVDVPRSDFPLRTRIWGP